MPSDSPSPRNGRRSKSFSSDSGLYETLLRFWQKSYAGDYLGLILLFGAYALIVLFAEPFHAQFHLDDVRIQHPHAEVERVSVSWLVIYAGAFPLAALLAWSLFFRLDLHKIHVTILGLVISILTACFITDLFKDAIGRPRPDLIARCKPDLSLPHEGLVTIDICTETDHHTLHDGWRSYPSGHSSFAFAGLGWLALFIASQLHVIRPRASLATALIALAPLIGAALIAVSRLEDYRHDVGDVVSGGLLGALVAYFNWRRYYPSLLDDACHEPYAAPTRSGRSSPSGGFQRVRDEEEGFARGGFDRVSGGGEDGERYGAGIGQR